MRLEQRSIRHQGFELTPLDSGDRTLFIGLFNDPMVMQYIGTPLTDKKATRLFQQALTPKSDSVYYYWSVSVADGTKVGIAALITQQQGVAEFGLMLSPEFCFKGYSVPILSGLINFGFRQWRLDTVVAKHQINHLASARLLRRLSVQRVSSDGEYWYWQLDRNYWVELNQRSPYLCMNGN